MATVSIKDGGIETPPGHTAVKTDRQYFRQLGLDNAAGSRVTGGGFGPLSPTTIGDLVERTLQAELEQARLFDGMLVGEITRLEQAARSIEIRRIRRVAGCTDDNTPPAELLELRARIMELDHQRTALWHRFLRPNQSDDFGNALKA